MNVVNECSEWRIILYIWIKLSWKGCAKVCWWSCDEVVAMKYVMKLWWSSISKLLRWKCNEVCDVLKLCWSCVANLSLNLSWWDSWIISRIIYHESFVKGLWWNCCESIVHKLCFISCDESFVMKVLWKYCS